MPELLPKLIGGPLIYMWDDVYKKNTKPIEVVHSIDDSHILFLNLKTFINSEFQWRLQKIELLAEHLAVALGCFDFVVGDHDKIVDIFAGLKGRQSEAGKRVNRELRPSSLFMVGTYFEDQISICARNALAVGYDVYLLNDATAPRDITHRQTFIARLTQAGVVLSTLQKMLYQWLAVETDQNRKEALKKLLAYPN